MAKIIGEVEQGEREAVSYSIVFDDYSTVTLANVYVYRGSTDVTSTVMPSGAHSTSNNVVTLKPLTALTGGDTYIIDITVTVTGDQTLQRWIRVRGIRNETGTVRVK